MRPTKQNPPEPFHLDGQSGGFDLLRWFEMVVGSLGYV